MMSRFIGLCRREWLEHRGGFLWAPASVAAIIASALALLLIFDLLDIARINFDLNLGEAAESNSHVAIRIHGDDASIGDLVNGLLASHEWTDGELATHLAALRRIVAQPFHYVYFVVLAFVLLGTLYDDRKDRTVLFWKSVPATDAETVLSKLVAAVWVAPAATIAMILATQIFLIAVVSGLVAGHETSGLGRVWTHSGLLIGFVELLAGYLIQGLWALPLYGWLLFISAAVNRGPLLWALLAPAALAGLEALVGSTSAVRTFIQDHIAFRALPRAHFGDGEALGRSTPGLGDAMGLFATADLWVGIAIGAAFLAGAIGLRQRKNEI